MPVEKKARLYLLPWVEVYSADKALSAPAEPISEDLAKAFENVAEYSNAWLMKNHGITIGCADDPHRALGILEMAEAMADSVRTAMLTGGKINEISKEEVARLEGVLRKRGLPFPGAPGTVQSLIPLYFGK